MNPTMEKFGYPRTTIAEYDEWVVLLRTQQVTVGSIVLAHRSQQTRFSDLPPEAFSELAVVTRHLESTLEAAFHYDKINYLMLMMVDPQVHFHVFPRYESERDVAGVAFRDRGWPKAPKLAEPLDMNEDQLAWVKSKIVARWPTRHGRRSR